MYQRVGNDRSSVDFHAHEQAAYMPNKQKSRPTAAAQKKQTQCKPF